MTRTLTQPLAAEATRHSRHFQLIVDVHLLLLNQGEVLLGRRANTGYGDGAYEPPSGRLAERETLVEAAVRVADAQVGIILDPGRVALAHVMHDVSGAGRMAFFLTADGWEGETGEPTKSYSDFGWFPLTELPANMIDRARVAVRNFAAGARFSTYPAFGMLGGYGFSSFRTGSWFHPGGPRDEVQSVAGRQGETFRVAWLNVEHETPGVPGLV